MKYVDIIILKGVNNMVSKYGTLIIRSDPSDAIVIVNGIIKTTPALFDLRGKPLPYNVTIEKVGYDDYTQKVVVQSGSKIEISAILTKIGE